MRNPAPTPGAGSSEKDVARPASSTPSVTRPDDSTFRDLARELVAAIEAIAKIAVCDCDKSLSGDCDCQAAEQVRDLADDARRRLWTAEIEADRNG